MATVVEKIQELEYNELLTLGVIEQNADLTEVFKGEINMPFNLLYKLQKEGNLNDATKKLLVMIFEKLILTKQSFINQYNKLGDIDYVPNTDIAKEEPLHINSDVLPIADEDEVVMETVAPIAPIVAKTTPVAPKAVVEKTKVKVLTEKTIPRRYGKQQIEKDILAQGTKATPLQRAGLKLNDLKNMNVNLMNKFIKEVHLGTEVITEEDALEIIASVTMLERKLAKILKKK
jgi:hypothetical protein